VVAGISTGKNSKFIRYWYELQSNQRNGWVPFAKGGSFRKWFGNTDYRLWYSSDALEKMSKMNGFRHDGSKYYFETLISWSKITSGRFSARIYYNSAFDSSAPAAITSSVAVLGFLNSIVTDYILAMVNPTLNFPPGYISQLPSQPANPTIEKLVNENIDLCQKDWNSFETSDHFDFCLIPWIVEHTVLAIHHIQQCLSNMCATVEHQAQKLTTWWHKIQNVPKKC
jgi:hypothetical protein